MKTFISLFVGFILFSSLIEKKTVSEEFKSLLPKGVEEELLKNMNSSSLNEKFSKVFHFKFDNVVEVDVHFNEKVGYYYTVYGVKQGVKVVEFFKIDESDIVNEDYSYIDSEILNSINEDTEYCTERFGQEPFCPDKICSQADSCPGVICGVLTNRGCAIW